jgi:hypothetical protein
MDSHSSARLQVARRLESEVDAIDLNLGCPQKCAERGGEQSGTAGSSSCSQIQYKFSSVPRQTFAWRTTQRPCAGYGAFLAEDIRRVELIVSTLVANLRVPVTAKACTHPHPHPGYPMGTREY